MGEKNFLRKTLSLQRWAFPYKVWDACRNDVAVPWLWMTTYTWMVFQPKASSWPINKRDGCWPDAHNQSEDNFSEEARRENPSWWIKQYHTWGQGQAWWTMQVVIVEDSPGWALHLQLSGWLTHEWANTSEEQRKLWDTNKGTLWRWSIKEGGPIFQIR